MMPLKEVMMSFLCVLPLLLPGNVSGWNDRVTHRDLTTTAVMKCDLIKRNCLVYLGFPLGDQDALMGKKVMKWFEAGAEFEDAGTRPRNHFHNPLKELSTAGLNDVFTGKSSILWAQDGQGQAGYPQGDRSWRTLRSTYYSALTSRFVAQREQAFADLFMGLGFQMHLIQDAAVPEHVRNDEHVLGSIVGYSPGPAPRGAIFFEKWAEQNRGSIKTISSSPIPPQLSFHASRYSQAPVPVSELTDAEVYDGTNPSAAVTQGLAEYTNANFFSESTYFAAELKPPGSKHYFPYPKASSTNITNFSQELPETMEGPEGNFEYRKVVRKLRDGEADFILAVASYLSREVEARDSGRTLFYRTFYRDEECHKDYAARLVPRAVGYSAALLDYFFRGTIEITPPENGLYAYYDTRDNREAFARITLRARNITPDDEEMSNGSIQLVVKYKTLSGDPFVSPCGLNTNPYFTTIVVPEKNNRRDIPRSAPVELVFELAPDEIPLNATDLYLQLVYRGRLGAEEDGVAVGFKDISEPTPVDFISTMDKICLNGNWLDAGSPAAIAVVDANKNGKADINEWDVYPHRLEELYVRFSPIDDPRWTFERHDFYSQSIAPGGFERVFILADYTFNFATSPMWAVPLDPNDPWSLGIVEPQLLPTSAVKNQTELEDPAVCLEGGNQPPCYVRHCPRYNLFRGRKMWTGTAFYMNPYPLDTSCPFEALP